MFLRSKRIRAKTEFSGTPQLTLAQIIVHLENIISAFARPLVIAGIFVALAWLSVFPALDPWVHLAVLVLITAGFFYAVGKARHLFMPVGRGEAKRRVEEVSGLKHRPFDVLEDRPVIADPDNFDAWQVHRSKAEEQVKHLRWPKWKLDFSTRDPYALRFALLFVLMIGGVVSWGFLGGRLIGAVNPAFVKLHLSTPTLDAWITPPDYTHLPPIMIATPAGLRHGNDVIDVPEGSIITAHIVEKDGDVPTMSVNGGKTNFDTGENKDYGITEAITSGDKISIYRGWQKLGSWRIRVLQDQPPQIALTGAPAVTERKSIAANYEASDDYGVTAINMKVTPRESLPGISNDPIEIQLDTPDAKDVKRTSYEDLTSSPWAGLPVQIQLTAIDAAGHRAESESVDFTLPERIFTQPVAQALIEERKHLLQTPDNEITRNEAANIMAGIAHQPAAYNGDPVVLMALRSGAVRLVLDPDPATIAPVAGILWESAVRIEDGTTSVAEKDLRDAQKDLADALDRNASEQEIQRLIDRLHQALAKYLSELASRMASRPGPTDDLSRVLGPQTNMISPEDFDRMLQQMRNLSASGSREAARQELSRLQQILENMRTTPPQLSEQQKEVIRQVMALREIAKDQQDLLDRTFRNAQSSNKKDDAKLSAEQGDLLKRLQGLMGAMKSESPKGLEPGAASMGAASASLRQGSGQEASSHQNDAVRDLQQALQEMTERLRMSMMMIPMPGRDAMGQGRDPFGRPGFADDGSVKLPGEMQARRVQQILEELQHRAGDNNRSKIERDYIERLLQNF